MPAYRSDPPAPTEVLAACSRMERDARNVGPSHAVTVAALQSYVGDVWDMIAAIARRSVDAERSAMVAECEGYMPGGTPPEPVAPRLAHAYADALNARNAAGS